VQTLQNENNKLEKENKDLLIICDEWEKDYYKAIASKDIIINAFKTIVTHIKFN